MRTLALLLVGAFILNGCGPHHTTFVAPSSALTPPERVQMFMDHRPVKRGTLSINGEVVSSTLIMSNGTEVVAPEDLEPLVGENTETMRYARESVAARRRGSMVGWLRAALFVGGFILVGPAWDAPLGTTGQAAGWTMMLGGILVTTPIERYYTRKEIRLRRRAFSEFPAELGARLRVCARDNKVIPCEAPLAPASTNAQ